MGSTLLSTTNIKYDQSLWVANCIGLHVYKNNKNGETISWEIVILSDDCFLCSLKSFKYRTTPLQPYTFFFFLKSVKSRTICNGCMEYMYNKNGKLMCQETVLLSEISEMIALLQGFTLYRYTAERLQQSSEIQFL